MPYRFYDITLYYWDNCNEVALEFTTRQHMVSGKYVQFMNNYKPPKITRISVELKDKDEVQFYVGSILIAEADLTKAFTGATKLEALGLV